MAETTKVEKPKKITQVDILLQMVETLDRIEKKLEAPKSAFELPATVTTAPEPQPTPAQAQTQYPIPTEYRNLVDTLLNKKFVIELDYQPDSAAFQFSILVPREYSNAGDTHWATYKEDRRSKVILNALGVNGVRDWATQIYGNLNPEIQSRIVYDRSLP